MTCDGCVKSVSDALYNLEGITKVDANLKDQLVAIEGTGKTQLPTGDQARLEGFVPAGEVLVLKSRS